MSEGIKIKGTILHNLDHNRAPEKIEFTQDDLLDWAVFYYDGRANIMVIIEIDGKAWQFTQKNIEELEITPTKISFASTSNDINAQEVTEE